MGWPHSSSGQPTHGVGEFGGTTEYARLIGVTRANSLVDPELIPIIRLAALLFVAPIVLFVAWLAGQAGVRDMVVSAQGGVLGLWTLVVVAIASSQIASKSRRLIWLRKGLLALFIAATAGIAAGYVWVAQTAHSKARPGAPRRAFVYLADGSKMGGLIPAEYGFQLANGSNLGGGRKRKPFDHGSCVTAQLIRGPYGFRWVRVVEWTPPPGPGQLHWPVRREDCFSKTPLSKVRR